MGSRLRVWAASAGVLSSHPTAPAAPAAHTGAAVACRLRFITSTHEWILAAAGRIDSSRLGAAAAAAAAATTNAATTTTAASTATSACVVHVTSASAAAYAPTVAVDDAGASAIGRDTVRNAAATTVAPAHAHVHAALRIGWRVHM